MTGSIIPTPMASDVLPGATQPAPRFDVQAMLDKSASYKPFLYNSSVAELVALYEDSAEARAVIRSFLIKNGLGLRANNDAPMHVGMLEYVIERLSGRYDYAPTRRWRRSEESDKYLDESSPEHKKMSRVLDDMAIDSILNQADHMSNLCSSVFCRVYGTENGLRPRLFTPDLVERIPHPQLADEILFDSAIMLRLADDWYEIHEPNLDGSWRMRLVDKEGAVKQDVDNSLLPIVRLDAAPLLGKPWAPVRLSRAAYTKALSGMVADLQAITAKQAHSLLVYITDDPNNPTPKNTGMGVIKLSTGDELRYEHAQAFVDELKGAIGKLETMFLFGERIPMAEAKGDTPPSGAQLKVQERPLRAKREAGRPIAVKFERDLWRIIARLHNEYRLGPAINETYVLDTILANSDQPEDNTTILTDGAAGMALGVVSPIDITERLYNVPRSKAIEIVERVHEDLDTYKPPAQKAAMQVDQGESADIVAAANGEESGDSVTDAALGKTASDARDERRPAGAQT